MPGVISISNLTKTYATGSRRSRTCRSTSGRARSSRCSGRTARARRRSSASSAASSRRPRARCCVDGHDIGATIRAARERIGLVPQELTTDAFETVWATATFSRGLFGRARDPALRRARAARPVALGPARRQDHDALRRHEAPRDDRQGAVARAAHPVPRRADGGRRRRAAPRHVGARAAAARRRA